MFKGFDRKASTRNARFILEYLDIKRMQERECLLLMNVVMYRELTSVFLGVFVVRFFLLNFAFKNVKTVCITAF